MFGVEAVREGREGRELPTNLTVIVEGENRLFATRGDDHCTVDELRQDRVGALGGPVRVWRVVARGFCIAPASTLSSDARIVVSSFDFAGTAVFEDDAPETAPSASPAEIPEDLADRPGPWRNSPLHSPRCGMPSRCSCSWARLPPPQTLAHRAPPRSTWRATRAPTSP